MARDFWRFVVFLAVPGLAGLWCGQFLVGLLIGALLFILWLQQSLQRLLQWLHHRREFAAPDTPGVFEEICREIDYMRDRHKRRKKRLSAYLKQFQAATAALPDATVVLGINGDIQWANAAASGYLGLHWPRDVNQRLTNLVRHPALREVLERDPTQEHSLEIPAPDLPDLQLNVLIVPFGDEQRLFVARDVTRMHRATQMRRDFVANASHELRTPLTVLAGYLETLQSDERSCPQHWKPAIEQMRASTSRMQDVIEKLLLLSRLELEDHVSAPQPVPVAELLARICKQAQALSGGNRHLISLEADSDLWIQGDPTEIYSAFSNLVNNAVQYTPARGVIRIRWYHDEHGAHFAVIDTGPGIRPDHIPRITERFYRVDQGRSRSTGGSGLGLSIVKHVLARHGASLAIESTLGVGSMFRCDFPDSVVVHRGSPPNPLFDEAG